MSFSGSTPTHGTDAIEVGQTKENRVLYTIGGTTVTADFIITQWEIRGFTYAACSAFLAANDNSVYKSMSAQKLRSSGGLLSYITEAIDLMPA